MLQVLPQNLDALLSSFAAMVKGKGEGKGKGKGTLAVRRPRDEYVLPKVDVYSFASPCTSFSNAGKRDGIENPNGALFFKSLEVIAAVRPRLVISENVPQVATAPAPTYTAALAYATAPTRPMATPTYAAAPISVGEKGQQSEQALIARDAAFLLEPNVTLLLGACWPCACFQTGPMAENTMTESTALREKANISNVESIY